MRKIIFTLFFVLSAAYAFAEDQELSKIFSESGVEGTIVITSLNSGQTFIHNDVRAELRLTAASTFKIPNSLVALEEKVVSGKDSILKWDGQIYDYKPWNKDQTLESAFKVSCVWCYQGFALQIGPEKYRDYLSKLSYGKLNDHFETTTFWLDGSLTISAIEQINFLKAVYLRSLPFSGSTYDTLQEIMIVEKTPDFVIRAKTGWGTRIEPQVGWYVGYVETKGDVWFFATNIKVTNSNDLFRRKSITREALQLKGII